MCSGYGVTFDSAGWWGFDNDTVRNVINFGVDNSSSSYSGNSKNNFLILGEGQTFGINESFGWPEKNLLLILLIKTQHFPWVYISRLIIVICLLIETFTFKVDNKN